MGALGSLPSPLTQHGLAALKSTLPLNTLDHNTQLLEIFSYSPHHHDEVLERIRIKKNYDCPYVTRILDSHTVHLQNMCSSMIKTYVVIEKPHSLADELAYRTENCIAFDEKQLWTIIYSCCMGSRFLLSQGVVLTKITPTKTYVDSKGHVKISDPELLGMPLGAPLEDDHGILQDISLIAQSLMKIDTHRVYSSKLREILRLMLKPKFSLELLEQWIDQHYLKEESTCPVTRASFSTQRETSKSKKTITVVSSRKNSQSKNHSEQRLNIRKEKAICLQNLMGLAEGEDKENRKANIPEGCERMYEHSIGIEPLSLKKANSPQQDTNHCFPKKALFSQRRKRQLASRPQQLRFTIETDITNPKNKIDSDQGEEDTRRSHGGKKTGKKGDRSHQTGGTHERGRRSGQKLRMISYQVDKETSVCELSSDHSDHLAELLTDRVMSLAE